MTPETKEAIERLKMDVAHECHNLDDPKDAYRHSVDVRTLIAAIEAMEPRPISEAPENTPILIHDPSYGHRFVVIARTWNGGWTDDTTPCVYAPTKWWPLPLSALPQPEVKG